MTVPAGATVGFVGLGTMGARMVRNLLRNGFAVRAFDVLPEAVAAMVAEGAVAATSVADSARGAAAVVTMLPDTPDVRAVIMGEGGLRAYPPEGRIVVDMSTISPVAVRDMAATLAGEGVSLLDAPVSGGPQGAEAGTLTIMAGGEAEAFARSRPVLEAMGTTINHVGPSGAGQTVKLCNQLMVGINIQSVCEALALARAAGVELEQMREVLLGGSAASWMLERLGPQMIRGDVAPGFRIDLQLKDLRLVGELATELAVPLPGLAQVTAQYLEAKAHGEGGNGNQALFRVYDRMTNRA